MIPNIWQYPHISFMGEHGEHPFFLFWTPSNGVLGGFKVPHVGLWGPRTTPREPVAGSSEATGGACLSGKTWGGWKNAGFCQEKGRFDPGKTSKPRTHFFKTNPGNMMIQPFFSWNNSGLKPVRNLGYPWNMGIEDDSDEKRWIQTINMGTWLDCQRLVYIFWKNIWYQEFYA